MEGGDEPMTHAELEYLKLKENAVNASSINVIDEILFDEFSDGLKLRLIASVVNEAKKEIAEIRRLLDEGIRAGYHTN